MRIARVSGWIVVLMCASAMVAAAQISHPGGERPGTVHVELEDATEKSPITPGPSAPVHELLGERLLDANRPADALKEFEVNLTKEPNRFRMSDGAGHPAEFAEDRVTRFAQSPQYPLLPRELEIELALSAAPKHLRSEATVWTLDQTGYKVAKQGTNAFSCIVSRRAGDLFPVCWDAEGARSLLPLDFDDAQMRLAGKPGTEIEAVVAQRFKSGNYHPPARAGIAYMLSPMRYRIDEHGVVSRTASNPHLMFYGPNLTDTDIGGARGAFVFINRVGPDGMMIVPVGEKEREAIVSDAQSLIAQVEQAIGYQPSR